MMRKYFMVSLLIEMIQNNQRVEDVVLNVVKDMIMKKNGYITLNVNYADILYQNT